MLVENAKETSFDWIEQWNLIPIFTFLFNFFFMHELSTLYIKEPCLANFVNLNHKGLSIGLNWSSKKTIDCNFEVSKRKIFPIFFG